MDARLTNLETVQQLKAAIRMSEEPSDGLDFEVFVRFRPLAAQLLVSLGSSGLVAGCDLVVPVPSHPVTFLRRGFDPARELARPVGRRFDLPTAKALARRWTSWGSAKRARADRRPRLLASAFVARRRVENLRILLVDDVLTTGATASAD